jgi:hypothetical protein
MFHQMLVPYPKVTIGAACQMTTHRMTNYLMIAQKKYHWSNDNSKRSFYQILFLYPRMTIGHDNSSNDKLTDDNSKKLAHWSNDINNDNSKRSFYQILVPYPPMTIGARHFD